mmetsp:Transcript_148275/g.476206  ORF Transcript_148275/g.476206 Transcript_148275/m.476206 type:complete len:81 (-) Transcript_148275:119-361(-)
MLLWHSLSTVQRRLQSSMQALIEQMDRMILEEDAEFISSLDRNMGRNGTGEATAIIEHEDTEGSSLIAPMTRPPPRTRQS